jgi:TaqI-like C-terminal specificity domain
MRNRKSHRTGDVSTFASHTSPSTGQSLQKSFHLSHPDKIELKKIYFLNEYEPINLSFLLGILNSKLTDFVYNALIPEKGKAFAEVKAINVKQLPIKNIDFKNPTQKKTHDEIVNYVETLLDLNEELKEVKLQTKIDQIKQHLEHSEEKINELVYQLYDLTEKEIKIIEGSVNE